MDSGRNHSDETNEWTLNYDFLERSRTALSLDQAPEKRLFHCLVVVIFYLYLKVHFS